MSQRARRTMERIGATLPWADLSFTFELDFDASRSLSLLPRWLGRSENKLPGPALRLSLGPGDTGLPRGGDVLRGEASWPSESVGELRTTAGMARTCWEGIKLVGGEGEVSAEAPALGLEALARTLLILGLQARGILCIHAAAVRCAGGGYLLLGDSGAGKTTTARRLGHEGLQRLADDTLALRPRDGVPRLFPLPFERRGRPMPGPPFAGLPCVGGGWVRKGGPAPSWASLATPWEHWPRALMHLTPSPVWTSAWTEAHRSLDVLPVHELRVPPRGPLAPLLRSALEGAPPSLPRGPFRVSPPTPSSAQPMPPSSQPTSPHLPLYRREPSIVWRRVGEQVVLLSPSWSSARTLNAVGSLVWERVEESDLPSIAAQVASDFEVSVEEALRDVRDFLDELLRQGLVSPAKGMG